MNKTERIISKRIEKENPILNQFLLNKGVKTKFIKNLYGLNKYAHVRESFHDLNINKAFV